MTKEDNTVAIVHKAIQHYSVPVTYEGIRNELLTHPNYPSLKSVCDAFESWNVQNFPVKVSADELKTENSPFIAHTSNGMGKFVFVESIKENEVVFYEDETDKRTQKEEEFFKNYTGVSLFIKPSDSSKEEGYKLKLQKSGLDASIKYLLVFVFLLTAGWSLSEIQGLANPPQYFANLGIKLLGLTFSILLFLKDLSINTTLSNSLCGFSNKTDCDSILDSDHAKVFGWLHWSDVGIIYFLSGFIAMSISPELNGSILKVLSLLALLFVPFSIYYQQKIIKKWCPLCLGVQGVFTLDAITYLIFDRTIVLPSSGDLVLFVQVISVVTLLTLLFKKFSEGQKSLDEERMNYTKFRRNPAVFMNYLTKSQRIPFNFNNKVFALNHDPQKPLRITAFLSLSCKPCQKAYNELKAYFDHEQIAFDIIIASKSNNLIVMEKLAHLYQASKTQDALDLLDRWYNASPEEKHDTVKALLNERDSFETIKDQPRQHLEFFDNYEIPGTPSIFINGYEFPADYEVRELKYYLHELVKS